ncbi:protein decapentaplegic [Clarias gariepinus]
MQNSATQCYVLFACLVLFSSSLRVSRAVQDSTGSNQTLQLEALKTSMLEYLGMDRPPPFREKMSHQNLIRIYRQYQNMRRNMLPSQSGSSLFLHTTVQPLNSKQNGPDSKTQWFRAVFHRESHITDGFFLAQAQLRLQRPLDNSFDEPVCDQKILVSIHITSHSYMKKVFHSKKLQSTGHNVTMDVTFAVNRWLMKTSDALLIVDVGFVRNKKEGETESTPQICLELTLMDGKVRKPRSTYGESVEHDSNCGRRSLSVSFEEIGWSDWIVAPAGYTMYFCDGSCPHNYKPASMHTQIKSRLHRLTKGATPRPCCVPAEYEPMILMHYDSQGKLKLTSFNDLIVTKCHCA